MREIGKEKLDDFLNSLLQFEKEKKGLKLVINDTGMVITDPKKEIELTLQEKKERIELEIKEWSSEFLGGYRTLYFLEMIQNEKEILRESGLRLSSMGFDKWNVFKVIVKMYREEERKIKDELEASLDTLERIGDRLSVPTLEDYFELKWVGEQNNKEQKLGLKGNLFSINVSRSDKEEKAEIKLKIDERVIFFIEINLSQNKINEMDYSEELLDPLNDKRLENILKKIIDFLKDGWLMSDLDKFKERLMKEKREVN